MARPRQTSCRRGHRFTDANTRLNANNSQVCAVCARRRDRDWKRQHRAHLPIVDDKPATVALIVWAADLTASWTFHRDRAAAVASAPGDGSAFTVIDVVARRKLPAPRIHWPIVGIP